MIEDRPEFQESDPLTYPEPEPIYFDLWPNLSPSSAWLDRFKRKPLDEMLFQIERLETREESR